MGRRAVRARPAARLGAALRYGVHEAVQAFRRNGLMSVASVTTIMVTLLLVGGAAALASNIRHLASLMEREVEVVAYLREGLTGAARERIMVRVRRVPEVRTVEFVGKDRALAELQATLGERVSLRDIVSTNPLPDSLEIGLHHAAAAADVAAQIRRLDGIEEVAFGVQVLDRLLAATGLLRSTAVLATALLAAVALIIIMNTIRLTILGRRQEIEIMQLVGAGGWYLRGPFLLEGAVGGLLATLIAAALLVPGYFSLLARARVLLPFLPMVEPAILLPPLVLSLAGAGLLIGMGGSVLALRRFLLT